MNKKLTNVQWGEYRLGDLFNKKTIRGVPKSEEKLDEKVNGYHIFGQNIKYQYPQKVLLDDKYLTKVDENKPILAYTSSTCQIGMIKESFYRTGNNGAFQGLFPKFTNYTYKSLLYILTQLMRYFAEFGYDTGMANVLDLKFSLPTKNGEIDFEFMESFVAELEAYLLATGLKDYELTDEEKQAIDDYKNGEINLIELKISDIFNVSSSKKRFDANKVQILSKGYPYVVRTSNNNGIRGYLNEDSNYLNDGNTISFGQDTATMFYQENPYFTGDKIKILKSKFKEFNKYSAQYFISAMAKVFSVFSWGASSFSETVINEQKIFVKIKDNKIDFEYMEILISAVQKLVIKDVVLYADRKIEATRQVIER